MKATTPNAARDDERRDEEGREPVALLSEIERELESADPQRQQADAPVVDLRRLLAEVRRIEDVELRHHQRRDADRQVDVEDPSPAVGIGQPSAEDGPQNRGDDDAEPPEAHGLAALLGRERLQENRLRERLHRAAGRALDQAERDERGEVRRQPAQQRRDGEAGDRRHQQPLAAEVAREPARHRQDDRVGDEIRRQDPRGFVDGRREVARDVGQRHVDDGRVEHLHEGREHDGDRDDPRVDVLVVIHWRSAPRSRRSLGRGSFVVGRWSFVDLVVRRGRRGSLVVGHRPSIPAVSHRSLSSHRSPSIAHRSLPGHRPSVIARTPSA